MHCLCVDRRNKGICQKNIFKKLKSHFFAIAAYIIWYGTWTASAKNIVQQFVANVGNTVGHQPRLRRGQTGDHFMNLGCYIDGLFYGHLIYFLAIWHFCCHLVYISPFWYIVSRKIWQPCYEYTFRL
jgi:hypothetical protein